MTERNTYGTTVEAVLYKSGSIHRMTVAGSLLEHEINERVLDNERYRHVLSWSIYPLYDDKEED